VDHVVIKARKGVAADGCNKQRHLIFYITSNLTMEVMAVSKDMVWLDTQRFLRASFFINSMSMLMKMVSGWL
jgi:hypothetical protein